MFGHLVAMIQLMYPSRTETSFRSGALRKWRKCLYDKQNSCKEYAKCEMAGDTSCQRA